MAASSRRSRRAARRRIGEREISRQATAGVRRILELTDRGLSPAAVASSTGLKPETVAGVLALRQAEPSEEASP